MVRTENKFKTTVRRATAVRRSTAANSSSTKMVEEVLGFNIIIFEKCTRLEEEDDGRTDGTRHDQTLRSNRTFSF